MKRFLRDLDRGLIVIGKHVIWPAFVALVFVATLPITLPAWVVGVCLRLAEEQKESNAPF